jgi:hypothetical protein
MSRLDPAFARIQRWDERVCVRMNRALRYATVLWSSLFLGGKAVKKDD